MRTLTFLFILIAGTATAAPSSSTLTGEDGTLKWTVTSTAEGYTIKGSSPKWTVTHKADSNFKPIHTERTDAKGQTTTIEYRSSGADIALPKKNVTLDEAGLWDADTVDIRLGQSFAKGKSEVKFRAIDSASGKVYGFESKDLGSETCGAQSCQHVKLTLSGALKYVGPKFNYWFAADGTLLRFEGPIGDYERN